MVRFAETAWCRRRPLLAYFGEDFQGRCDGCDNCRAAKRETERTDVTREARWFLECVRQTGELFGPAHVVDVLRGSRSQRVLERGHERLPFHGNGVAWSKATWRALLRQFLELGLVEQDPQFGSLRLTARSHAVLAGEKVLASVPASAGPANQASDVAPEHDPELFERLRKLRRELAIRVHVPAYVILSDRALVEMATRPPQTPAQLLAVHGVGEVKLAHYGEAFLEVIRDHCAMRNPATVSPRRTAEREPTRWVSARRRHQEIGEAFAAGGTVHELAARFGIKPGTVLQNLTRHVDDGARLDADRLLAESRLDAAVRERVFAEFARHGIERLGPVREALDGTVSYEELHLLRLHVRCRGGAKLKTER
jgi:ATP-dependent DNA helicase RecQ